MGEAYIGPHLLRETKMVIGSTLCAETVTLMPYGHEGSQDTYGGVAIQNALDRIPGDRAHKYVAVRPLLPDVLELAGGAVQLHTEQLAYKQGWTVRAGDETNGIEYRSFCLLVDLALNLGTPRTTADLLKSVWGETEPSGPGMETARLRALNNVHATVKRARAALGPAFGDPRSGAVRNYVRPRGYVGVGKPIRLA